MTKKSTRKEKSGSNWTIVEKRENEGNRKRLNVKITEYDQEDELLDELIEERWANYRANRNVNATIDYRYDYHK